MADRVRAEVADHASVAHQAPDHALAQAAFLELAFLEGLAEVAAPVGQVRSYLSITVRLYAEAVA